MYPSSGNFVVVDLIVCVDCHSCRGAYSSVVAARHKESGEEVAVKVMKRKLTKACPQFAKSTLNEIRVLQNVRFNQLCVLFGTFALSSFTDHQCLCILLQLNKSIDSPGVLHVYGCYYDEGRVSVVTQQCTGGDMFDMYVYVVNFYIVSEEKWRNLMYNYV